MAEWWESAPLVEETPSFSDVEAGGSSSEDEASRRIALNREFAARGGSMSAGARGMVPSQETPVEDQVDLLTSTAGMAVAPGVASAARAKLLPFLARIGANRRTAGAVGGAAMSLPAAGTQLLEGDVGGAAKAVAGGAALGAVMPGAFGGKVAPEVGQLANRLRQIAEQSGTNKATILKVIDQEFAAYGFPTAKAMKDYVFQARTRI